MERTLVIHVFAECEVEKMKELANMIDLIMSKNLGKNTYTIELADSSTGEYFDL